ncbi:MAG: 3-deoxy-manno-octulosonate cytidylyltransferase [Elusimicrobia bacterium ADurb.Bin231]|nr:MAG: 3-deoxy-manno-octulosonate cytidylyltransferase [Elusimicrobia bacterium ADurb.Bin231]
MKVVGIIPARYGSSRFPGKPLVRILGKPMIRWVYEGAKKSKLLDQVIVATDDKRIFNCVTDFGGDAIMTPECSCGTDRVAYVARKIVCDIVANIQGDEPLINEDVIDAAVLPLIKNKRIMAGTAATEFNTEEEKADTNNVKVLLDRNNYAVYFSRMALPCALKHIGIYAFRKKFLIKFSRMGQTPIELAERLEQLRILENGFKIYVGRIYCRTTGVDTEKDLKTILKILSSG